MHCVKGPSRAPVGPVELSFLRWRVSASFRVPSEVYMPRYQLPRIVPFVSLLMGCSCSLRGDAVIVKLQWSKATPPSPAYIHITSDRSMQLRWPPFLCLSCQWSRPAHTAVTTSR